MSKISKTITASQEYAADSFVIGLQSWVDEAPDGERASRITAMERMIAAKNNRSTSLDLVGLALSSLPSQIGNLTALTGLVLRGNQLTTLPAEIGNLTALTELYLSRNLLTTLPAEIGNLTALTRLVLAYNPLTTLSAEIGNLTALTELVLIDSQLTTLPAEIGNLAALTRLDLSHNQLTTLPAEIGNLAALTMLNLDGNQLTTLPAEIGNLTALTRLYLSRNQLTTLPDSLLAAGGNSVDLTNNLIPPAEVQRLSALAQANGVTLEISIHDYVQPTTANQQALTAAITDKILARSPTEEAKKELQTFFESPDLNNFKRFLAECPRTEGWKSHEAEMTGCLFEIVNKMSQSEAVKTKCETLAATAFETCGDRVGLAFVQMQLSLNLSDKKLEEMSVQEVYDYAKQESVIKFLSEKAEAKIKQIRESGGGLDEIETHLAYLQIGKDLGLNLEANGMLYQACSNVTTAELNTVKQEFQTSDRERRIAEHIYEDGQLRLHPFVQKIIGEVGEKEEFNADEKDGESEQAYLDRVKNLGKAVAAATISEIQKVIQAGLTNPSATSVEEVANQQAPEATATPRAASRLHAALNYAEAETDRS